ncbi:MAG: DUF2075 domain-containing protein [Melioribacteraceae bacterium]|nr:DUF2075 domain-containing protein [Melioribacteraceae bacterium]
MINSSTQSIKRAYYSKPICDFRIDNRDSILGVLTNNHHYSLEEFQKNAWKYQIKTLQENLTSFSGFIFFEFAIPRMGKRVDNILIIGDLVFVIEFKVSAKAHDNYAIEQVVDYVNDLKNFHEASHDAFLIPLLISTGAKRFKNDYSLINKNSLHPILSNSEDFATDIQKCLMHFSRTEINPYKWLNSIYRPTPTIIEAAKALYRGHDVKEISSSEASRINLSKTQDSLLNIISHSKTRNTKSICFVTGVPGSGKTLAGLNIANRKSALIDNNAVFLSGNGPLVDVLIEALARDKVKQSKKKLTKKKARSEVRSFVQNIHHFRDEYLVDNNPPINKIVIFDEAQRAWDKDQASKFMQQKRGIVEFNKSEPEFLIEVMNRHENWCTIICLIGGGQEINTGEAGIEEWIISVKSKFPHWEVYYSNKIVENSNYLRDSRSISQLKKLNSFPDSDLHLAVPIRSFRSEKLADFVETVILNSPEEGKKLYSSLFDKYPIFITHNFTTAKDWLKKKARGSERIGLLASSGAHRLRPIGINVKMQIDAPIWFLNKKNDIRSSYFLEEVATEFDIQGLELDWTCLCWDADFYIEDGNWRH